MTRRCLPLVFAFLLVAAGADAQPPPMTTVLSVVWSDGHELQASGNGPSVMTVSRAPDGAVLVREDAPTGELRAIGRCRRTGDAAVARCPGTIVRARITFAFDVAHRLVVEPHARMRVAVFSLEGGNDSFDLRGASAALARCGVGRDSVLAPAPMRIWGSCETVNGAPWQPRTRLGFVHGADLDAAPGGIAWVDPNGLLHLRTGLDAPERVVAPPQALRFGRLDVGVDAGGRAIATVATCDSTNGCGHWQSRLVASGARVPLRLVAPRGCQVAFVARWRGRTALGVECGGAPNVVVTGGGRPQRFALPSQVGSGEVRGAAAVDLRGDLLTADFDRPQWAALWALRVGARPCRALLDAAATAGAPGQAHIAQGGRVVWPFFGGLPGSWFAAWNTVASVSSRCGLRWRYQLPDRSDRAATLVGPTLLRASYGRLTAERLVTVAPPMWRIGDPGDFNDDVLFP